MGTETMWLIRGSKPVLWTIPFYVVQHEGKAEMDMFAAIPLLPGQKKAADAVIIDHARPFNGAWKIIPDEIRVIGCPTAGGDPEGYFSWERRQSPRDYETAETEERRRDYDEFLDALYQSGVGNSRSEVGIWWGLFCNHALDWMLNKGRAVDFGFVKLHPSLFRRNWPETLVNKISEQYYALSGFYVPGKRTANFTMPKMTRRLWREQFINVFSDLSQLAFDKTGISPRYIDVEHKRDWVKNMMAVETARKNQMGDDYVSYVQATIRRCAKTSYRLFRLWAMDCLQPCGVADKSGDGGVLRVVPTVSPLACYYQWVQTRSVSEMVSADIEVERAECEPSDLPEADGDMPAVSSVQSESEDMRDGGGDVSGSADEKT